MAIARELLVVDSRDEGSASCVVCGNTILAGGGFTVRHGQRTMRFKCVGCLSEFEADPERFLAADGAECCSGEHAHSPASEWCDR
jgi:hypothetical protein